MHTGWAKSEFDYHFRPLVIFALDQAEKVREGKKPIEIYPINVRIVQIQRDTWGLNSFSALLERN
jgi:hypothetical protein